MKKLLKEIYNVLTSEGEPTLIVLWTVNLFMLLFMIGVIIKEIIKD
jgi:hypothetical protein